MNPPPSIFPPCTATRGGAELMTPSPRIIPGEVVRRTLTRLNLFPVLFITPTGRGHDRDKVCACTPVRDPWKRRRDKTTGGTRRNYDGCTYDRSRLPFFFESSSYLFALDIRSFSALLLNININLRSTGKPYRDCTSVVLSSSRCRVPLRVCFHVRIHTQANAMA